MYGAAATIPRFWLHCLWWVGALGLMLSVLISNKLWWNGPSFDDLNIQCSQKHLTRVNPFSCTGVDYAELFFSKGIQGTLQSSTQVLRFPLHLITTKVKHLELVSELTATAFFTVFRRFVNRKGYLHSETRTNFVNREISFHWMKFERQNNHGRQEFPVTLWIHGDLLGV